MINIFGFNKFIINIINKYKNITKIENIHLKDVSDQFKLFEKGIKTLGYKVEFSQKNIKRIADNCSSCKFTIDYNEEIFLIFKNGTVYHTKESEDKYIGVLGYYDEFLKGLKKILKEEL
jgi:hypothetical protein